MTNLTHEQFLLELSKLFQASRLGGPGAVTITLKHYNGQTKPIPREPVAPKKGEKAHVEENSCLFRAKLGRKVIRTVVHAKDVNKFHLAYGNVLKANMDNLEKRSRKEEHHEKQGTHKGKVTKTKKIVKPNIPMSSPQKKATSSFA